MSEGIEMIKIELERAAKVRIKGQIDERMEELEFSAGDFAALDLGLDLPEGWPADKDCEPTLAEFVVLGRKLGIQFIINITDSRKV